MDWELFIDIVSSVVMIVLGVVWYRLEQRRLEREEAEIRARGHIPMRRG